MTAQSGFPTISSSRPDVAVLGAGVMGLVMAATAVRAGLTVDVFEASRDLTAGAGWRSGGMLAPDCEADGAHPDVPALGRRSLALWPGLVGGVTIAGTLVVAAARDQAALARFARATHGHTALDGAGVAAVEPALAGRFGTGLLMTAEGHLDPRATLRQLHVDLVAAGVRFAFGRTVEPSAVDAGAVVDARGLGARGHRSDLRGVKGEMVLVRCPSIALSRPVRLLHHRHPLYVVPRADHVFMIGATTIESDADPVVTLRSAGELLTQAYALHPGFAEAEVIEFAAGLRPAFPDNAPRLERTGRVVAVNGLYRHGWLLAPALAERALRLVGHVLDTDLEIADAHRPQRA